ncbi:Phosphoribosyltransferase domain [Candidatus Nanopelagicaceae bacterium]
MEALVGPFIEGWALGKYSGKLEEKSTKTHTEYGYLKYGKLVHDYKYESFKSSESSGKSLRSSIMLEINTSVDYFLNGYFPSTRRDFDTVVAVPSSRGSASTIQSEICRHLVQGGFQEAVGSVHVKEKGRAATKNIPGLQARLKSVGARYELGSLGNLQNAKGLLLIDDIYQTGATLRTTVEILNAVVPAIPKYFLTVTYIN